MEQSSEDPIPTSAEGPSVTTLAKTSQKVGSKAWGIPPGYEAYHGSSDASLFSSSLPVLPHEKLKFTDPELAVESIDDASSRLNKLYPDLEGESIEDTIGNLLPGDENELLAGIMDDFDLHGLPNHFEEMEEYDIFLSGGDLELDFDPQESLTMGMGKLSVTDGYAGGNGTGQFSLSNGVVPVAGEHPYGEHPSRTLFVRNINSNVEDSELRTLFEQFGDIRNLYTSCKHRGFVMISYYDIRSARTAMRALQNKPLRRRKLDIHFSIPKDNPSDKDINQGTLVVFNLDPSVSNDDLRQIFGAYGEVKEIRETPHKRHHKFIEFFDVRAAEAALRSLNRSDIAGKRIKLEPSRPGGARRNLMQQLGQELEQDETRSYRPQVGSPIANSPPGSWAQFNSSSENNSFQTLNQSRSLGTTGPIIGGNHLPGLASILPPLGSSSVKVAPIGKDQGRGSHMEQIFSNTNSIHGAAFQHSHSFPEHSSRLMSNIGPSPVTASSLGPSTPSTSGFETLTGQEFLWGSPTLYSERIRSSAWPAPSMKQSFTSNGQRQGFPYSSSHGTFIGSSPLLHQHHVGSAPSGVPLDSRFGFYPESPEMSFVNPVAFGGRSLSRNDGNHMMNMNGCAGLSPGVALSGSTMENGSPSFRMISSQRLSPMFFDTGVSYPVPGTTNIDGLIERGRSRRVENNVNQIDNKKQYQLELDKIVSGEDTRTTLMIKNIPNKYTSKMLLVAIDENHRGTYDFLYLPIDFKNKCNVGYAFINMISPSHIIPFYQAFNGKKWEKFNSEKVASLAYARIQGKAALVNHFQNSSLMNEDKRCRPILFHSETGDQIIQEPFPSNITSVRLRQQDGAYSDNISDGSTKGNSDEKEERTRIGSNSVET
eukprot:TRINITY_DN2488_c0_g1_i4.p1 TRINITY_DN2488_c0_g1~~TRINITY_DN2488_c0_g1_i4.p1  ORF type:complete len:877 (+),score=174.21 TRINITY_DN2488_c0_g1_i4:272-2902(+)